MPTHISYSLPKVKFDGVNTYLHVDLQEGCLITEEVDVETLELATCAPRFSPTGVVTRGEFTLAGAKTEAEIYTFLNSELDKLEGVAVYV